jgi:hypothetical protein
VAYFVFLKQYITLETFDMIVDARKRNILFNFKIIGLCLSCSIYCSVVKAQHYEARSAVYNAVLGGISGGIGAIINKRKEQKWNDVFVKGFLIGAGGGAVMYSGKKLNTLITNENNVSYAWFSRSVFCAGTSVVENVASGRKFWSVWHYDIGFIRIEYDCEIHAFQPKVMPAAFTATLFLAVQGRFDLETSLRSGTPTFRTRRISYQPALVGSTVTNAFLVSDTLVKGRTFYDLYAHEMVHSFQFGELSGFNHFFKPFCNKWETASPAFSKVHRWVYGDLNHELMLFNYFIIQGGSKRNYCNNFLENEAETLTIGRPACE